MLKSVADSAVQDLIQNSKILLVLFSNLDLIANLYLKPKSLIYITVTITTTVIVEKLYAINWWPKVVRNQRN